MSDKTYPEMVTAEMLPKWADISDAEVEQDIADTEREIAQYRELREAEQRIAQHHPAQTERRMADFKAGARVGQIAERQRFVDFLRKLQAARVSPTGGAEP